MSSRKEIIEANEELHQSIINSKIHAKEQLEEMIMRFIQAKTLDKKLKYGEEINNFFWEYLEKVYSMCVEGFRKIYNIKIDKINIKDLPYQEDGKTLDERINFWKVRYNDEFVLLRNSLFKVLDTEVNVLYNKILQNKVAKYADYVEVINGDGCCENCYNTYENKLFAVEELRILPPFHPDCNCYVVFYQSEDLDYDEIQEAE